MLTLLLVWISKPSRSNSLDACTCTPMYRSPAGPPFVPLSPSERTRSWLPDAHPAGTFTFTSLTCAWVPLPRQLVHRADLSTPPPPQSGQTPWACITPSGVCMTCNTTPRPPHLPHETLPTPGFWPEPLHGSHFSSRRTCTGHSPPKHAVSKGNWTSHCKSAPFCGPLWRCRPPMPPMPPMPGMPPMPPAPPLWKKLPKRSPRISSRPTPDMLGPPPMPSKPASPNWSYLARFCSSERTSYARAIP
mmetsp:Transcript_41698/g.125955  ORF Transcript_41698/g.125955 Transcript_41698/m.125955 type:complete len:246 (-) Transcript_41698:169-906(-)